MCCALILAIFGIVWRYTSRSQARTALLILAAGAFVYSLGDGLARLNAAGNEAAAASQWNAFRFLGIAFVPPALLHFAASYPRPREQSWIRILLLLAYAASGMFAALRLGTNLIVTATVVEGGTIHAVVGPAFLAFAAFGLLMSGVAFYLFAKTSRTSSSPLERGNSFKGYIGTVLPFFGSLVYFGLFRTTSSPTFDPIVPPLTIAVALFASAVFSHDLPAASLAAIREIFSALPDGLVIVNRKGLVTFANPAAVALLGAPSPGIEGDTMESVLGKAPLPEGPRDALLGSWKQVMSGERDRAIVGIEFLVPAPRVVSALVAATDASDGRPGAHGHVPMAATDRFVFLSLHDETDSRAKQHMLSRANEVKDLFITMIGHDLKAPLNAITGYSELIGLDAQGSADALAVYRYSQQILDSARQIQLMMENARIFSRLVDPQDILRAREAIDLGALVEKEISNLRSAADRRSITVQFLREGDEAPAEVFAAPILRSVFQNVVDNAIKYSPEKSKVSVILRPRAGNVEVDVVDDGPGIPGDKRDAIFQKFTRLDQTRTRTDGLGLGLAISRQIVELHGGSLTAQARPDGKSGALFRVSIPRGTPAAR